MLVNDSPFVLIIFMTIRACISETCRGTLEVLAMPFSFTARLITPITVVVGIIVVVVSGPA